MKLIFFVIIGALFVLTTLELIFKINTPWYALLDAHMPIWAARMNVIMFDIMCLILLTKKAAKLSPKKYNLVLLFLFISLFFMKVSIKKAPYLSWTSIVFLAILALILWGSKNGTGKSLEE